MHPHSLGSSSSSSSSSSVDDDPVAGGSGPGDGRLPNRAGLEHASKRFIDNLVLGGGLTRFASTHPQAVGPTWVRAETTARFDPQVSRMPHHPAFRLATGSIVYPLAVIKRAIARKAVHGGTRIAPTDVMEYSVTDNGEVHFTFLSARDGAVRVVFDAVFDDLLMCTPVTGDEGPGISGGANLLPKATAADLANDTSATRDAFYAPARARTTTTAATAPRHRRRPTRRDPPRKVARKTRRHKEPSPIAARTKAGEAARRRQQQAAAATSRRKRKRVAPSRDEDDSGGCRTCLDRPIGTVMVPCGHMALCTHCGRNPDLKACPVCRCRIQQVVETHTV